MRPIGQVSQFIDQAGGQMLASSFNAFLTTPTGQNMLRQIEEKAKAGVTDAAAANALNLMLFALAGGAIGGTLFKGPVGTLAAAVLAFWAGNRILASVKAPAPQGGVQGFGMLPGRPVNFVNSRALCAR